MLFVVGIAACDKKSSESAPSNTPTPATDTKPVTPVAPTTAAAAEIRSDATCEEAANALVPPQATTDGSAEKIKALVLGACNDMGWSEKERGCLASVAGDIGRCEAVIGGERLQAIFEGLQAKMRGPDVPAPTDVAAAPKDAKKTAKGVFYKVLKAGAGKTHPTATSSVTVHYTGWTTDGKMFDSSVARNEPATFPLNGVIPGWTDGLQTMVEGQSTRFWIPSELAYNNQPGRPAGMLVFDVELLKIAE